MEHMDWIVSKTVHLTAQMAYVTALMVLAIKVSETIFTKIYLVYI